MIIKILPFLFQILIAHHSFAQDSNPAHCSSSLLKKCNSNFVSIKSSNTNLRTGPNVKYPIKWTFIKSLEPVEIIGEFEQWRKVRDFDNDDGWIHNSLINNKKRAIVKNVNHASLYQNPNLDSNLIAKLENKVRVNLLKCNESWCKAEISNYKGWLQKKELWGVSKDEIF